MIDELRWPSLQDRRRAARLTMLYKIRHKLVCTNNFTMKLQPAVARQRRGYTYQYVQPRCRTQYQQQSFLPRTIQKLTTVLRSTCCIKAFMAITTLLAAQNLACVRRSVTVKHIQLKSKQNNRLLLRLRANKHEHRNGGLLCYQA